MGKFDLISVVTGDVPLEQAERAADYLLLKQIDRARALLTQRIDRLFRRAEFEDHRDAARRFYNAVLDGMHDASFKWYLDAADEADRFTVRMHNERVVRQAPPICISCGNDLDELTRSKNAQDRGEDLCNFCERQGEQQCAA